MALRSPGRETMWKATQGWERARHTEARRLEISEEEMELFRYYRSKPEMAPVNEDDFRDVYNDVDTDLEFISQQKKEKGMGVKSIRGELLENIIAEHVELSDWFGDSAYTVRTAEYDDRRGVDIVFEFARQDSSVIRVAADVTVSERIDNIDKKETVIKEGIKSGQLASVKYFQSEIDRTKGKIEQLPHILLSVSPEQVQEIAKKVKAEGIKIMGKDSIQLLLIEQLHDQLDSQVHYSLKILMEKLDSIYSRLSKEAQREVRQIATLALDLETQPKKIERVLKEIENSKNLLKEAQILEIQDYLTSIFKIKEVLDFSQELREKKNNSFDRETVKRVQEQKEENLVIQAAHSPSWNFDLPPYLRSLVAT